MRHKQSKVFMQMRELILLIVLAAVGAELIASEQNHVEQATLDGVQKLYITCIQNQKEYCKDKPTGFEFNDGCRECQCKEDDSYCKTPECVHFVGPGTVPEQYCADILAKNMRGEPTEFDPKDEDKREEHPEQMEPDGREIGGVEKKQHSEGTLLEDSKGDIDKVPLALPGSGREKSPHLPLRHRALPHPPMHPLPPSSLPLPRPHMVHGRAIPHGPVPGYNNEIPAPRDLHPDAVNENKENGPPPFESGGLPMPAQGITDDFGHRPTPRNDDRHVDGRLLSAKNMRDEPTEFDSKDEDKREEHPEQTEPDGREIGGVEKKQHSEGTLLEDSKGDIDKVPLTLPGFGREKSPHLPLRHRALPHPPIHPLPPSSLPNPRMMHDSAIPHGPVPGNNEIPAPRDLHPDAVNKENGPPTFESVDIDLSQRPALGNDEGKLDGRLQLAKLSAERPTSLFGNRLHKQKTNRMPTDEDINKAKNQDTKDSTLTKILTAFGNLFKNKNTPNRPKRPENLGKHNDFPKSHLYNGPRHHGPDKMFDRNGPMHPPPEGLLPPFNRGPPPMFGARHGEMVHGEHGPPDGLNSGPHGPENWYLDREAHRPFDGIEHGAHPDSMNFPQPLVGPRPGMYMRPMEIPRPMSDRGHSSILSEPMNYVDHANDMRRGPNTHEKMHGLEQIKDGKPPSKTFEKQDKGSKKVDKATPILDLGPTRDAGPMRNGEMPLHMFEQMGYNGDRNDGMQQMNQKSFSPHFDDAIHPGIPHRMHAENDFGGNHGPFKPFGPWNYHVGSDVRHVDGGAGRNSSNTTNNERREENLNWKLHGVSAEQISNSSSPTLTKVVGADVDLKQDSESTERDPTLSNNKTNNSDSTSKVNMTSFEQVSYTSTTMPNITSQEDLDVEIRGLSVTQNGSALNSSFEKTGKSNSNSQLDGVRADQSTKLPNNTVNETSRLNLNLTVENDTKPIMPSEDWFGGSSVLPQLAPDTYIVAARVLYRPAEPGSTNNLQFVSGSSANTPSNGAQPTEFEQWQAPPHQFPDRTPSLHATIGRLRYELDQIQQKYKICEDYRSRMRSALKSQIRHNAAPPSGRTLTTATTMFISALWWNANVLF